MVSLEYSYVLLVVIVMVFLKMSHHVVQVSFHVNDKIILGKGEEKSACMYDFSEPHMDGWRNGCKRKGKSCLLISFSNHQTLFFPLHYVSVIKINSYA